MDLLGGSIEIIKAHQNVSGAYVACPNFKNYHYCWLRDGSFIANAMDTAGETGSSGKFFDWVHQVIVKQSDRVKRLIDAKKSNEPILCSEYLPTRYHLDGSETNDEWPNHQIDGYGTWLWALCEHVKAADDPGLIDKYRKSILTTIDYLTEFWSITNYDCWEENGDKVHPSTLACIYGGLKAIASFINDDRIPGVLLDIMEFLSAHCIVDGRLSKFSGSASIDASLLWVSIPFGILDPYDKIMVKTVEEIEKRLLHNGGVHRYPEDTYYGGGEWLLLSCWLGWYYVKTGRLKEAKRMLDWAEEQALENGELPEQVLYHVNNQDYIEKWENLWGPAASPLLWSHAMYIVLNVNLKSVSHPTVAEAENA